MLDFIIKYWIGVGFGLITAVLTLVYKRVSKFRSKHLSLELALRALLRDKIITMYNKYMEKGEIPFYELDNLEDLFTQYKNLGGNGVIRELVDRINDLPITRDRGF